MLVLKCPGSLFFVCYSPVRLMKASPVGFQSRVFWWPIPHVGALKVGALNVPLKEKLDHTVLCQVWGLLGKYV